MDSLIRMKGIGEGIKLILSPDIPFGDILHELYCIVRANRKFFDGEADIYITGREVSPADKLRLESVMKSLFPSHKILYGDPLYQKRSATEAAFAGGEAQKKTLIKKEPEKDTDFQNASSSAVLKNTVKKVFHSAKATEGMTEQSCISGSDHEWKYLMVEDQCRTEFFKGDIHEGEIVRVDGNLLIEGNVLPGGVAQASGTVIIIGSLQGIAWAGAAGDEEAYIMSLDFMPMQIRIADHIKTPSFLDTPIRYRMKKAFIKDNELYVEPCRMEP